MVCGGPETWHAGPPGRGTPCVVPLVVLDDSPYYQMRISPRLQAERSDLEAVDSMFLRHTPLPDGPTILPLNQLPDPLTAIVLCRSGSWHAGQDLYCLWEWAQELWQQTK